MASSYSKQKQSVEQKREGHMNTFDEPSVMKERRRPWVSPALKNVGTIGDIVQTKISIGNDGQTSFKSRHL